VTVYSRSKTDIFIRHSGGIANIKLENLDPETVARLNPSIASSDGSASAKTAETAGNPARENELSPAATDAKGSAPGFKLDAQLRQQVMSRLAGLKGMSAVRINPAVIWAVLGVFLVAYLFLCYCLKLICEKTGNEPGFLIWVPMLQMFPLLRAAGMSAWWFLGLLVPLLGIVVQIIWCFKITQARGKSFWVAIGLLFPITNLASLLYLAFSDGKSDASSGYQKVPLAPGALPVEA
jgi:hypothetical protein